MTGKRNALGGARRAMTRAAAKGARATLIFAMIFLEVVTFPAMATADDFNPYPYYSTNDVRWYSVLTAACSPGSSDSSGSGGGSTASSGTVVPGAAWSLDDVTKFLSAPVSATWGVSDSAAEQWFLGSGTSVIGKYGLNAGNIGAVTAAVKANGVSPVFFYLYAVNEGGGAGGFINHYSDETRDAAKDAARDAKYLTDTSKNGSNAPATGGGLDVSLPDPPADAKALMDKLPSGSVGKVYIAATSAVTAEIEFLYGKAPKSTRFALPVEVAMTTVKDSLKGDPLNAGASIGAGGCAASASADPNQNLFAQWAQYLGKHGGTDMNVGVHYSQGPDNCAHADAGDASKLKDCIDYTGHPLFHGAIDCSGFQVAVVFMATGIAPGNIIAGPGGYAAGNGELMNDKKYFKQVPFEQAQPGDFWVASGSQAHIMTVLTAYSGGNITTIDETGQPPETKQAASGNIWRYTGPWTSSQAPPQN